MYIRATNIRDIVPYERAEAWPFPVISRFEPLEGYSTSSYCYHPTSLRLGLSYTVL